MQREIGAGGKAWGSATRHDLFWLLMRLIRLLKFLNLLADGVQFFL